MMLHCCSRRQKYIKNIKAKSFYAGSGVWPGGGEANYEQSGLIPRYKYDRVVYISGAYRYLPITTDHKRIVKLKLKTNFKVF